MTGPDNDYIRRLLSTRLVEGPVLELGTGYGGACCRGLVESAGLKYYGTDMKSGPGVDFPADFERPEQLSVFDAVRPFGAIFILNVLEHTFDPIRILDNAATLLKPGGKLVVITPSLWPLHNYPMDAWRALPNFYEEYAKRRGLKLLDETFEYIGHGPVKNFRNPDSSYAFPPPISPGFRYRFSRIVHKVFNTFGRGMFQPSHLGLAGVFQRS